MDHLQAPFGMASGRARGAQLQALARVARLINGATDLSDVYGHITSAARELTRAALTRLWIARPGTEEFVLVASDGVSPEVERPMTTRTRLLPAVAVGGYAGIPLLLGDRLVGVLSAASAGPRDFTDDERTMLAAFGAHAALAIDKARLHRDAQAHVERLHWLTRLTRDVGSPFDLERLLAAVIEATLELLQVDEVQVWVVDGADSAGRLRATRARDGQAVTRSNAEAGGARLTVPLLAGGRTVGTLLAIARTPRTFSHDEQELISLLAAKAAVALGTAELYCRTRQRADRLATLSEVMRLVNSADDTDDVCNAVARAACSLLGGRMARLWLAEPQACVVWAISGAFAEQGDAALATTFATISLPDDVIAGVVERATEEYIDDVEADPRFVTEALRVAGYRSAAVVPLMRGVQAVGGLSVFFSECRRFTAEDKEVVRMLADEAAIAIEKSRLNGVLRLTLDNLREKNADLDSFVSVVSHDLKAPLVAIQGLAGALRQDYAERLDEGGQYLLGRIETNIERMEELIVDLLEVSRVGREGRPPELVSVKGVVDDVLEELGPRIRERGIKVMCADLGTVVAIRTQMVQIWSNLLTNAVKYLGDTAEPLVEVGMTDRGAFVEYWVRDNGIGIEPEYHARVFEMFHRLKEVEAEGSGIGLFIVRKIVEAAGGRVWVESARGQGSTFHITWPRGSPAR